MRLRGLIFDLDGTIADTIPVCCAAFQDALLDITGEEYRDDQIVALFGPSEEGIFQRLLGDRWQAAHRAFLAAYEARHDKCAAPFPGIEAVLELLNERGVELAIVTGKGRGSADISVRRLGLAQHFNIIESGSPEGIVKAAAIEDLLARWNLPAEEVAYVGDAAYDTIDARKTGVVALAAGWAATADLDALRATEPDELFATVDAFAKWIEEQTDGQ